MKILSNDECFVDVKMWVSSNKSNTQENDGVVDDTRISIEDSDLNGC